MTLIQPSPQKIQKHILIVNDSPVWIDSVETKLKRIGEITYDSTKEHMAGDRDKGLIQKIESCDYQIIFVDNSVCTNLLHVNLNVLNFYDTRLDEVRSGSRFNAGEMLVMWMKTVGVKSYFIGTTGYDKSPLKHHIVYNDLIYREDIYKTILSQKMKLGLSKEVISSLEKMIGPLLTSSIQAK